MANKHLIALALLPLAGCEWANNAGSHLPVVADQPCEYWQCFTTYGQQQSDAIRQQKKQQQQAQPAQ